MPFGTSGRAAGGNPPEYLSEFDTRRIPRVAARPTADSPTLEISRMHDPHRRSDDDTAQPFRRATARVRTRGRRGNA
ncbi:hypothetical protein GCM10023205_18300 [Yinghuangia aomiensis]|uniref:Uncharacterized protein n=1 Tax=Yinghuangia aomiensis TaxID=676205 RepID=A0ABP9GYB3_9ACTN